MPTVSLVKYAGRFSVLEIIDKKVEFLYPIDHDGSSSNWGEGADQIAIHLTGAPDESLAVEILDKIDLPSCEASGLKIINNIGQYVVDAIIEILADPVSTKFIKVCASIDDATGELSVLAFEKTTGVYGDAPAGKTICCDLKEFSVGANEVELVEVNNFIK